MGGVLTKPSADFNLKLLSVNADEKSWENTVEMALRHKLFGKYHDDKRARVEVSRVVPLQSFHSNRSTLNF